MFIHASFYCVELSLIPIEAFRKIAALKNAKLKASICKCGEIGKCLPSAS